MKTISLSAIIITLLLSTVAFSTSVDTDYEGSGDLYMQTTIISPIGPSITDTVDINTGCNGGCCCCPDCFGEYSGNQYLTNNPFSASYHIAQANNGCVEIEQYYVDYIGDHTIENYYYTYFNGTGYAETYVYVVPGEAMGYQLANGTGTSYVSFSQIAYIGTEFDFSTTYGGSVWVCAPGYAGLYNQYYYSGGEVYYNSEMGLYCSPTDESSMNAFMLSSSTDHFSINSELSIGDVQSQQSAGVGSGESDFGFSASFYDMFDDLYFGFNMELG